jgi:hypothetical protein
MGLGIFQGLNMTDKSIKISEDAHTALAYAKGKGIKQGIYASIAILEAIQRDFPDIYLIMKKELCKDETFELVSIKKAKKPE